MNNIKKGNALKTSFQVVAHQVNAQGKMGAGIAKSIKEKYPDVFDEYAELCEYSSVDELMGMCLLSEEQYDGKFVANLFGQASYGIHERQTDYKSLHSALYGLRMEMEEQGLITLTFPYMIGCGLAGGNVEVVLSLIEDIFDNSDIIYNFYDYNN